MVTSGVCTGEPARTEPDANSAYVPVRTLHLQLSMEEAIVAFLTLPCTTGGNAWPPEHIVDNVEHRRCRYTFRGPDCEVCAPLLHLVRGCGRTRQELLSHKASTNRPRLLRSTGQHSSRW